MCDVGVQFCVLPFAGHRGIWNNIGLMVSVLDTGIMYTAMHYKAVI